MVRRDGLGAASAGDALDAFYSPRSVVVVGASRRPGKLGHDVMVEYARLGLAGAMYGVIPLADVEPVGGWPVVRSVGELPEVPALALVALGVLDTLAAVDELARAGVRAAVLAAAGLGELGGVAAQIEREIAGVARSAGMRLLGANGFGLFSGPARLNLTAWREVLAGRWRFSPSRGTSRSRCAGFGALDCPRVELYAGRQPARRGRRRTARAPRRTCRHRRDRAVCRRTARGVGKEARRGTLGVRAGGQVGRGPKRRALEGRRAFGCHPPRRAGRGPPAVGRGAS